MGMWFFQMNVSISFKFEFNPNLFSIKKQIPQYLDFIPLAAHLQKPNPSKMKPMLP